jgi:hypothetical protein
MDQARHPRVQHAMHLRIRREQAGMGTLARVNDWAATHLAAVFGIAWTIWAFMVIPLVVLLLPAGVKSVVFYLASGWIQLFSLPLMIYVGNRLQRSSDAQSDVMHQAQTHIAQAVDVAVDRLDLSTQGGLTEIMAAVRAQRDQLDALATLLVKGGAADGS